MFPRGDVPTALVESLSEAAGLPVVDSLGAQCPGAFDDWLIEAGIPGIIYEVEHAGLPALCARHLHGLEALVRSSGAL